MKLENIIEYPRRPSEAEIQATIWQILIKERLDARLEVTAKLNLKLHKLDIVIFRNEVPQIIIECKSWSRRYSKERQYQLSNNTKQLKAYLRWGLPVFICGRMEEIPSLVTEILNCLDEDDFCLS